MQSINCSWSNWLRDQIAQIEPALKDRAKLKAQINWGRKLENPTIDQVSPEPSDLLMQNFSRLNRHKLLQIPLETIISPHLLRYFAPEELDLISKISHSNQNEITEEEKILATHTAITLKIIDNILRNRYLNNHPNWSDLSEDELDQIDQLARRELQDNH
jgi:hypothetical protein